MIEKDFYKLNEICNITTGKLDANAMTPKGKYPFYTCDPTPSRIDNYAYDLECVLIGGNNAAGNFPINYYKGKFNAYQRTYIISVKEGINLDTLFIYYLLKQELYNLKMRSRGSLTKFLTIGMLNDIKVPKLTKQEYADITKLISIYDFTIKNNKNIVHKLEEYTQLKYYKWFTEFNFLTPDKKPYKESGGKMKSIGGKSVPEKWEIVKLGEWEKAKLIKSGIQEYSGEKGYLTTSNIDGTNILWETEKVTYRNRTSRANMQPISQSVWFAKMKNSPKTIFVTEESLINDFILSTGFAGIKCDINSFPYIATYINSELFNKEKDRRSNGSTQQAINNKSIKKIDILKPDDITLRNFSQEIYPLYLQMDVLKHQNKILEEKRDILINELI